VVSVGCLRGGRNAEHPVTVRAPEDTDIVHQPDAGEARGLTNGTREWWFDETVKASLVGGLSHLSPGRSSLPDRDARRLEFEFQLLERIA
jgi:hypothetical protein